MCVAGGTHLVVPPVGARPDLHSLLELVRPAQHVVAHLARRRGARIVQTDDKERLVDHVEAERVPFVVHQVLADRGPRGAALGREDAESLLRDLVGRSAGGVVEDCGQVGEESSLGQGGAILRVEDLRCAVTMAEHRSVIRPLTRKGQKQLTSNQ